MMPLEDFLQLPTEEVAALVRASGTKVCVFPFNGTQRWFLLEYSAGDEEELGETYMAEMAKAYIRLYKLVFDHGIETVVAPVFGKHTLERGEEYMLAVGQYMTILADYPEFVSFYKDYGVRVRFYGDYKKELKNRYQHIVQSFDQVTELTLAHDKHRLLYGVCADEATEAISELTIQHYIAHNKVPSRAELIQMYYGEQIEKADLFIGFESFTVFDHPMLNTGDENMYFMVSPSLYMTQTLLRRILFDHMYLRPVPEPDYRRMSQDDFETMRKVYRNGCDDAFGVGVLQGDIWYDTRVRRS